MAEFRATKIFSSLDAGLQLLLFLGYIGVFVWNNVHQEKNKVFTEYGELALYAGLASTLTSFSLDVLLLYFVTWNIEMAICWWSYMHSGFAITFWAFHLVVIYIGNGKPSTFPYLSLGVWAFVLLYSRLALVMLMRADYLQMLSFKNATNENLDSVSSKSADIQDVELPKETNNESVGTTRAYSLLNSQSNICTPSTPADTLSPRVLNFKDEEESNVQDDASSSILCTLLGPKADITHIARNEPVMHAYNETDDFSGELPTVM